MTGKFYMLVNPYIEGEINKVVRAENSFKAARTIYESLSKYFNNSVKNFKFSLLKLKSDALNLDSKKDGTNSFNLTKYASKSKNKKFAQNNFSHFIVDEKMGDDNEVEYVIKKYNGKLNNVDKFTNNIIKIQKNVKKENNDSDTVQSESDSVEQAGGKDSKDEKEKKKSKYDDDDDDSSSSSSDDYYVKKYYNPISYWYYYPTLYNTERLYLPTFISPLSFPYVIDIVPTITYGTSMEPQIAL